MPIEYLMVLFTTITFLFMWVRNERVWQLSYAVLFVVGLLTSSITYIAMLPMVTLAFLLNHYKKDQKYSSIAGIVALLIGLALGLHVVPGFNNYEYASDITLSASAASFDIWFNWDKSMFGLFVLGIVLHSSLVRNRQDLWAVTRVFLPMGLAGILAIYCVGMLMGYSAFDWTPAAVFLPWALKNIVFTVLAEEAFFRGVVQNQLTKNLNGQYAGHLSVIIAGVLFGIAHFGGGIYYVLLSSLSGILYGYTYKATGRIEAPIMTHFLLNAGHFLMFTYPYSAV